MRRLASADLAEADKLAKATAHASEQLDNCRKQIDDAVKAAVNQTSDRWGGLCNNLENAVRRRNQAQAAEGGWWQGKGFDV